METNKLISEALYDYAWKLREMEKIFAENKNYEKAQECSDLAKKTMLIRLQYKD